MTTRHHVVRLAQLREHSLFSIRGNLFRVVEQHADNIICIDTDSLQYRVMNKRRRVVAVHS